MVFISFVLNNFITSRRSPAAVADADAADEGTAQQRNTSSAAGKTRHRSLLVQLAVVRTEVPSVQQHTVEALQMDMVPEADLDTRCCFPLAVLNKQMDSRAKKLNLYSARVWEQRHLNCRSESPVSPLFQRLQFGVSVVDTHKA